VLPKSATFASFLLVAATLSLLTILLAIKLPHILSLTTHFLTPKPHKAPKNPDTKHSYIKPSRILIWAIYFRYHIWGTFNIFLRKKYDRIQACFENIRTSMRSFMRRRCPYFIYMVYVLLVDMFLWRLFITLPLSELDYDLNLFVPRRRNVVYNVKFSRWKLCMDLCRVVFLPLWFVLAVPVLVLALLFFSLFLLAWGLGRCLNWCCS
jgi:hypothetical protein